MDWIDLAWNRDQWTALVDKVMNFRVSRNIRKLLSSWTTGIFPRSHLYEVRVRNNPFLLNVKYLGVIFERRMTWRLHIERTQPKPWAHTKELILYSEANV
jgi:hypothetical protein